MSGWSHAGGTLVCAGRFVEGELDGELAQVQSARLLDAVAEQALSGEVEALDAAIGGDHDDGLGGVVQDRLELLLALAQGLGGAARLGDVACHGGDAHHAPGLVAQRRQAHRHRDLAAVAMMADHLEGCDALAVEQALRQRPRLLGRGVGGEQAVVASDHFLRPVAEDLLGAAVPRQDGALHVVADDRILGGIGHRGEQRRARPPPPCAR